AQHFGITLNTMIQAVWAILLARYSAQTDVLFGITVSGRSEEFSGIEDMVGLFANTIPLRVQISADIEIWTWLKEIQERNFEMRKYQFASAGQIQQWSQIPATTRLYESILVFENYPLDYSSMSSSHITNARLAFYSGARTGYSLALLVSFDGQLKL